jgi:hypothetical protein
MTCEAVKLPGGEMAIICHRRTAPKRCGCGKPATRLCDHSTNKSGGTCDRPLCDACAVRIDADHDLCPKHAAARATSDQLSLEGI